MSTLGKILTVLIVVIAIPVAVLVSREFLLREDWRALYIDLKEITNGAFDQRDTWYQKYQEEVQGRATDKAQLMNRISQLEDDVNARNDAIARLRDEKNALDQKLATLATSYDGMSKKMDELMANLQAARTERDGAKKRADDLEEMLAAQGVRLRDVLDKNQLMGETIRQLEESVAGLEKQIAFYEQKTNIRPPTVEVTLLNQIQGIVTNVDNAARIAEINLGSDDGVLAPMVFYVYDREANEFLAKLVVKRVAHDRSTGDLTLLRGTVRKGHHVTNRFE